MAMINEIYRAVLVHVATISIALSSSRRHVRSICIDFDLLACSPRQPSAPCPALTLSSLCSLPLTLLFILVCLLFSPLAHRANVDSLLFLQLGRDS